MTSELPSREAFGAFWNREDSSLFCLARITFYFCGLVAFARFAPMLVVSELSAVVVFAAAVLYAVGTPMVYWCYLWKHYDSFLRCPKCRDWVGRDVSGSLHGSAPKWRVVLDTNHCVRCGQQMILEDRTNKQNQPMQPSGEVGRFEVDGQPSPPADRNRSSAPDSNA